MTDWDAKFKSGMIPSKPVTEFSDESNQYLSVQCTNCAYKAKCIHNSPNNQGCTARKDIYDTLFTKIEFKTEDPIATNRLRLITRYYVELILRRNFGEQLDKSETQVFKTVMAELSKLSIDKSGDLLNSKSKATIPWEQNEDVEKMKKELEDKRRMEIELMAYRKKDPKKKKKVDEDER